MKTKPYIVVTGTARCGMAYVVSTLARAGLNILHEQIGPQGIGAWQVAPWSFGGNAVILHQVRHPVHSISSIQTISEQSWEYIAKYIDIDRTNLIRRAMQHWYYWNRMVEPRAYSTYRVEAVPEIWPRICDVLLLGKCKLPVVSRTTNSRADLYEPLTIADLRKADDDLYNEIVKMGQRYGYSEVR